MKIIKMLEIVFMSLLVFLVSCIFLEQNNVSAKKTNTYKIKFDNLTDSSYYEGFSPKALKKGNTFYVTASNTYDNYKDSFKPGDDMLSEFFGMDTKINGSKFKIEFGPYKAEGKVGSEYMVINGKKIRLKAKILSNGNKKILVPLESISEICKYFGEYKVDNKKKIIRYNHDYYTTFPRYGSSREIVVRTQYIDYGVKNQKEYDLAMAKVLDIKKSLTKVPFDKYMEGYLNGKRAKKNTENFTEEDWNEYYGYKEAENRIGDLVKVGLSKKQVKEIYRVNEALDYFYNTNEFKYNTTNSYYTSYQSLYELLCQKKRSIFNENYFKQALLIELGYDQVDIKYIPAGVTTRNNRDLRLDIRISRKVQVFIYLRDHYFDVSKRVYKDL